MKGLWQLVVSALLGFCVGAALDETLHTIRNRQAKAKDRDSNEVFQRRVRCKSLADDFVTKATDDNTSLFLERIEFSPARHSCVGAFTRAMSGKRGTLYSYEAIDILTGETLYSGECAENDATSFIFCGNGRNMELIDKRDKTLEAALSSKE